MKTVKLLLIWFSLFFTLSSCTSVYQLPEKEDDTTVNYDEYFTDGSEFYYTGDKNRGFIYEGCWIYVETRRTTGPIGATYSPTGEVTKIKYGPVSMQRVVKYNPTTGTISSPCLDPNCNHSFESDCIMLAPYEALQEPPTFQIQRIVGDWIIILVQYHDDVYVTRNEQRLYNLKTGERRNIFDEALGGDVMTRWVNTSVFDGKLYRIKQTLDYSETDYDPSNDKSVLEFAPKTINTLCEYDIEKDKLTELFEIPENYRLSAVTNKRFFFGDDTSATYSCNRDGSNMKKEEVYQVHSNSIGNLAFTFGDNGFKVYDLSKDSMKTVTASFTEYKLCAPAEGGILFDELVGYDDYLAFTATRDEFYKEHKDLGMVAAGELFESTAISYLASCTARIYRSDYYGENMELLYEEENTVLYSVYATNEYIFVVRTSFPEEGGRLERKCVINIETGELTELPLLDVVVPSHYVN